MPEMKQPDEFIPVATTPHLWFKNPAIAQLERAGDAKLFRSEYSAMDIITPENHKNQNRNARNGRIGAIRR